jgi:hypothetical protein
VPLRQSNPARRGRPCSDASPRTRNARHGRGLIAYGLGNFLFHSMAEEVGDTELSTGSRRSGPGVRKEAL